MAVHSAVALLASNFSVHESWALPLSLFGLIACVPSLLPSLLPHFLAMWIVSIPLDVVWLLHRSDQARSIVITLMGFNMCLKVVSASGAARILQSQGVIPDLGASSYTFSGQQNNWLGGGARTPNGGPQSGTGQPFGLPGSWSQQASYRDSPRSQTAVSAPPYRSIYDEEADAQDADAPHVHVDSIASNVAAAAAAGHAQSTNGNNSGGKNGATQAQYRVA